MRTWVVETPRKTFRIKADTWSVEDRILRFVDGRRNDVQVFSLHSIVRWFPEGDGAHV